LQMIQEQRGGNVATYLYEPGTYVPLARVDTNVNRTSQLSLTTESNEALSTVNGSFYFSNHANGAPEEVQTGAGDIVWENSFSTWGNIASESRHQGIYKSTDRFELITQNLRFQGQYFDQETGLHYNTFRFFDPDIGRFISEDPIGLAGGENLQLYGRNPYGWIDPLGLAGERFPTWMATQQGYQRQHIVPYSLRNHPFFARSGMDINGANNMMRLSVAKGIDPNPDLGLHRGWTQEHMKYNQEIKLELDALENRAIKEKWDYRRVQSEILNLQRERRSGFKTGRYTCA
jgi:RHS repeat-associated protein